MLQLLLLRHAKSSWEDDTLDDARRPLNKRGRKAAAAMGQMMAGRGLLPELVLCSPAVRAAETWQLVSEALPLQPAVEIVEALYDFGDGSRLLKVIRDHGGASPRLLLVGHNPAIESLAIRLIGHGDPALRVRLDTKYPTGALAIMSFDISNWAELEEATGELNDFIRPRDLED